MKCLSVKKYLDETDLHGFGYTNDKNKIFVIFWAILTATCLYYTVHDLVALVLSYQLVPIGVSFSVEPNLNAVLPTPTLCMETMIAVPDSNTFTIEDITNDIKSFMQATSNGNNMAVNSTEMNLSNRLEYLTYLMLSYITDFELIQIGDQKPTYTDYVTKYNTTKDDGQYTLVSLSDTPIPSFIQHVYEAYMTYKISLSNLKRLVGMSICNKQIGSARYGKLMTDNQGQPITSICQADTITHLSFSLLCVKMFNTDSYTLTNGLTVSLTGLISASKRPFPMLLRTRRCQDTLKVAINTGGPSNFYVTKFLWYVDLQGRSVVPKILTKEILVIDPAIPASKYNVDVSTKHNGFDVPSIPAQACSNGIRQQDCIKQKKADMMSQSCKCWPSTLLGVANTKQMPHCSDNPTNLNPNVLQNHTYLQCNHSANADDIGLCKQDCLAYKFGVGVVDAAPSTNLDGLSSDSALFGGKTTTGSVEITFQSESLQSLIVESPSMPFTSFACAFGGIIGTYMGGSILAFVHILVFILAQISAVLTKRKKAENIAEKTEEKVDNLFKEEIYPTVMAEATVV